MVVTGPENTRHLATTHHHGGVCIRTEKEKGQGATKRKKGIDSKETVVRGETKNSLLLPPPSQPPGRLTLGQNRLLPKGRHEKRGHEAALEIPDRARKADQPRTGDLYQTQRQVN